MNEERLRYSIQHLIGYIDEEKLERWFVEMKKFYGFSEYEIIFLKAHLKLITSDEAMNLLDNLQEQGIDPFRVIT